MRRLAILLLFACLFLLFVSQLRAHGGGDLVAGPIAVGPYTVSVWLNPPDPWATEPIHFTVGVAAPGDGRPVLDAQILVDMIALSDQSLVASAPATTENSVNKLFYETDLEVMEAGTYETVFHISGPEGEGVLKVEIDVRSPSKVNWLFLGLAGLVIILILGWWRSRRAAQ